MTTHNTVRADEIDAFLVANEARLEREFPYGVVRQSTDNDIAALTAMFEKEAETK